MNWESFWYGVISVLAFETVVILVIVFFWTMLIKYFEHNEDSEEYPPITVLPGETNDSRV